jgi:hypothetical protein
VRGAHWRKIRKCVVEALTDHLSRGYGGRGVAALPDDIALLLRDALLSVTEGSEHPVLVRGVPGRDGLYVGRGNRRTLAKEDQIMWAVAYITLAELGMLTDKGARRHVQRAYGVSKRQVLRWLAERGGEASRTRAVHAFLKHRGIARSDASKSRVVSKLMAVRARDYCAARRRRTR